MPGGSPTQWRSGISTSLNSLTLQPDPSFTIPPAHNSPDGQTDSAVRSGISVGRNSGHQPTLTNVARFGAGPPPQRILRNDVLNDPDHFEDTPYVPPRANATQVAPHAEPPVYLVQDPQVTNAYSSRNPEMQQYPYEGETSPSESHHSVESSWSTSSSSSASSQRVPHEYFVEASSQYSQSSLPPDPSRHTSFQQHYPAYHGHHRLGLEHVRYADQPPSSTGGSYYQAPQGFPIDRLISPEILDDNTGQLSSIPSQLGYATSSQGSSSSSSSSMYSSSRHANVPIFSLTHNAASETHRSFLPDAGPYLRQQLNLGPHESVGLHSLPDPPRGEKPATPLPMLIKLAIYSSPNKRLTLQEIYTYLENRFEWFRVHRNDKAWKNSIRHNLSLNKVFRHVPRPITEPGKGSYWQLDISEGEGYKRPRKRRAKNRLMVQDDDDDEDPSEMEEERAGLLEHYQAGPGRFHAGNIDEATIDPELRGEGGHVVGEGRPRAATRRAGGSPYPSHSPHYQQSQLPAVHTQDMATFGHPTVRFGQPSFGQVSFPSYGSTRVPTPPPGPVMCGTSTTGSSSVSQPRAQLQRAVTSVTYERTGLDYSARRVNTYPPSQQETTAQSLSDSSSGSSQTWRDTRSRSQ